MAPFVGTFAVVTEPVHCGWTASIVVLPPIPRPVPAVQVRYEPVPAELQVSCDATPSSTGRLRQIPPAFVAAGLTSSSDASKLEKLIGDAITDRMLGVEFES